MHALFAKAAFRSKLFSFLVKGRAVRLVHDGVPDRQALTRTDVAEHDLTEAMRLHGMTDITISRSLT